MTKRFIEFATQNTDNGEITNGFQDIKTGEWYYTKNSENAKKICELLNELNDKNKFLSDFRGFITMEHQKIKEENEELKSENQHIKNTITEAYQNERTSLGKSVLKQLIEQME